MEESQNGSDNDNINSTGETFRRVAREMFERLICHVENETNKGIIWQTSVASTATSKTDGLPQEDAACRENEGAVQQHLISSAVFRWMERDNGDEWELENIWDKVFVRQLDDIGQKPNSEWHSVNYSGPRNIKVAMADNANVVLLRTTIDWSRLDGKVWSQQIVWSGSFPDCNRVLRLLEDNSNTSNSIQLRGDRFDLHTHLREQYIARHRSHPLAAAMAAVGPSSTVINSDKSAGTDDDDGDSLLCSICQETLSIGEDRAKRLPCKHLFHWYCILKWFYLKLDCPLCRDEINSQCSG